MKAALYYYGMVLFYTLTILLSLVVDITDGVAPRHQGWATRQVFVRYLKGFLTPHRGHRSEPLGGL
jgi:hypothetical protein